MSTRRSSTTAGRGSERAPGGRRSAAAPRPASPRSAAATAIDPLWIVAIVGLVVRLIALWRVPELTYDGTYYLRQAERLAHFRYQFEGFPPGYPFLIALFKPIFRDPVWAGRLVSFAAGVATVPLAFVLARRHLNALAALAVGLFLALHPHLVRVQVETLSESAYLLCILAAVLWWEKKRDLVSGALLGLAFWIRPEALLPYAGLLALRGWRDRRVPWALAAGLAAVVLYAIPASRAVGHAVLSPKQGQLDLGPAVGGRLWTLVKVWHASFPIVLIPGALLFGKRGPRHLLWPLAYTVLLPLYSVHIAERLLMPALPFLAILAAGGVTLLPATWRRPALVAAAVLFLLGAAPGYRNLVRSAPLTPGARHIGTALRTQLRFEDRVAGRFPLAAYYAGAGFVRAPRETSYEGLMDSIVALGATHLLVLESESRSILPQIRPLFDDAKFAAAESRLQQVAAVPEPAGERAILYRLQPPPLAPDVAPAALQDVESVTGIGGATFWAATRTGTLQPVPQGAAVGNNRSWRQPSAAAGGRFVVAVEASDAPQLARIEVASGAAQTFPATAADNPAWPTFVGDDIVFVRQNPPLGLRVFNPGRGTLRSVELAGLDASEASPEYVTARGRDLAITYRRSGRGADAKRVIAVATWPEASASGPILLQGRWATELALADPVTCWVPDNDALVASLAFGAESDAARAERSTLSVVQTGGNLRRLTYGLEAARRPALGAGQIAFVTGGGELRVAPIAPEALRIPAVRSYTLAAAPAGTGR